MIRFVRHSWWSQITLFSGGVMPDVLKGAFVYFMYTTTMYGVLYALDIEVLILDVQVSIKFFFGLLTYLMVFRLAQCHARFEEGKDMTITFFNALHQINGIASSYLMEIGKEPPSYKPHVVREAIAFRVHITRLTLAISVAFKYHCRIAQATLSNGRLDDSMRLLLFDYIRLRGLLYEEELHIIDEATGLFVETDRRGCCGIDLTTRHLRALFFYNKDLGNDLQPLCESENAHMSSVALPVVLLQMLRQHVMVVPWKEWGGPERLINLLEPWLTEATLELDRLQSLITMPLPLGYLQHCKGLFMIFFLTYPLAMKTSNGWWENIVSPCLLMISLYGIESISDRMENPLGDDICNINVLEMIHRLEIRAAEVFASTTDHWWIMKVIGEMPLFHMNLDGESTASQDQEPEVDEDFKQLCTEWGFNTHFAWMLMPTSMTTHMMTMARGADHAEFHRKNSMGPDRPSSHAKGHSRTRDLTAHECQLNLLQFESVTHFVCLRARRMEVLKAGHIFTKCVEEGTDPVEDFAEAMNHNVDERTCRL
eukprot:NODE_3342_length_2050_cov_4.963599.p1 GENE.NODE_3342_length_2050_cov_4.963599~~NODE_3342_length_2050_cov_4.963599.p1  ORF type:complete len:539 (+),score=172.17 NODE_3342_length_2050_cov_4.963599:177-1793(+)